MEDQGSKESGSRIHSPDRGFTSKDEHVRLHGAEESTLLALGVLQALHDAHTMSHACIGFGLPNNILHTMVHNFMNRFTKKKARVPGVGNHSGLGLLGQGNAQSIHISFFANEGMCACLILFLFQTLQGNGRKFQRKRVRLLSPWACLPDERLQEETVSFLPKQAMWGFHISRGTLLGVPRIRTIIFGGLDWGSAV